AGGRAVLLGHSERRRLFGETDDSVHRKLVSAFRFKLRAILCIGESLEERRSDRTAEVLKMQISHALTDIPAGVSGGLIVAYEPVWAIGTGQTATPMQIAEAHGLVRKDLSALLGPEEALAVRILYGGSVTPENIGELASIRDLDGVLVGGASLQPDGFAKIVKTLFKIKQEE
ncbi:MAG TPA: triose-phosphate isomerase, partial [Nitrospiria bacterium]